MECSRFRFISPIFLLFSLCLFWGSCSSSSPESSALGDAAEQARVVTELRVAQAEFESREALAKRVQEGEGELTEWLDLQVRATLDVQLLKERLERSLLNSENRKTNPDLPMDLRYDDLLNEFYLFSSFEPLLYVGGELRESAQLLLTEVQQVKRHALSETNYPLARLQESLTEFESLRAELKAGFHFSDQDKERVVTWLQASSMVITDETFLSQLGNFLLSPNGVPAAQERIERLKKVASLRVEIELLILDAWLKLARDIQFSNFNVLSKDETEFLGEAPTSEQKRQLILKRLRTHIPQLAEALKVGIDATAALVHQTYPAHEQYAKLLDIRDKYQQIVDSGGWSTIKPTNIRKGRPSPVVLELKKRLAIEGYYQGSEDDIYDDALSEAIFAYKETHQLETYKSKGEPTPDFWKSLNVPASERFQQITVNVQRWHKTFLQNVSYYVYVNVPDFQLEVWKDGQLQRRFPVVVGNSGKRCDPQTKTLQLMNATPLQHARMQYLEFNPYWIVPSRIEHQEYLKKILEDPNWLKTNGFEYYTESGHTVLRQLPSSTNSLGRVKFIFPNKHSTFFHDTPSKGLFKRPIRAFSHGCMRVQDPLELAELLLTNDGQWKPSILEDIEDMQPRRFVFKERFDVFIDYYTVRVDGNGRACFLADPYRYVRDVIDPPDPNSLKCTPKESPRLSRPSLADLQEAANEMLSSP